MIRRFLCFHADVIEIYYQSGKKVKKAFINKRIKKKRSLIYFI